MSSGAYLAVLDAVVDAPLDEGVAEALGALWVVEDVAGAEALPASFSPAEVAAVVAVTEVEEEPAVCGSVVWKSMGCDSFPVLSVSMFDEIWNEKGGFFSEFSSKPWLAST